MWDHTRQRWDSRLYPQAKQVRDLAIPKGCMAELTHATWKRTGWELNPRPVSRKSNALRQSHHATLCPPWPAKHGVLGTSSTNGRHKAWTTVKQVRGKSRSFPRSAAPILSVTATSTSTLTSASLMSSSLTFAGSCIQPRFLGTSAYRVVAFFVLNASAHIRIGLFTFILSSTPFVTLRLYHRITTYFAPVLQRASV